MLLIAAGSILLKRCESKSELEHQKYEKYVLHFVCLMQTGINGHEIYKHVGMMHAVVFADRAPEAKNAQAISENLNSDRNGQRSDKSKSNRKKWSFRGRLGGEKSEAIDRKCLKLFFENVLPTVARSTFLEKDDAKSELEHKDYESGVL